MAILKDNIYSQEFCVLFDKAAKETYRILKSAFGDEICYLFWALYWIGPFKDD
jgi:hypothetical protein